MSSDPASVSTYRALYEEGRWSGAVIGLGYVGLPLLVAATKRGHDMVGFDVSAPTIGRLNSGVSHVGDVTGEELGNALGAGAIFTSDRSALEAADVIFICVPSPLGRNRQPDLSYIEAAADTVAAIVRPGQLISLESTTYPGTTEDIIVPRLEKAGMTLDEDVFVAFSPERVSPGDTLKTAEIPKVVGGVTDLSGHIAETVYSQLVPSVHRVSSSRVAEMSKLLENTYRSVNIGLINEMAQLAHELNIDIWEVIGAAATKPFGFQPFYPGPGVGGHCIPLDPQYLSWRAKEANFATRFIDTADQVNTKMPRYNVDRIAAVLNDEGLPVHGTDILAVGTAYKPDVADDRESASLLVIDELVARGGKVTVYDPVVGSDRIRSKGYEAMDEPGDLDRFAIAVLLTDHALLDLEEIARAVPIVFDTRDAYRRRGIAADNVVTL